MKQAWSRPDVLLHSWKAKVPPWAAVSVTFMVTLWPLVYRVGARSWPKVKPEKGPPPPSKVSPQTPVCMQVFTKKSGQVQLGAGGTRGRRSADTLAPVPAAAATKARRCSMQISACLTFAVASMRCVCENPLLLSPARLRTAQPVPGRGLPHVAVALHAHSKQSSGAQQEDHNPRTRWML